MRRYLVVTMILAVGIACAQSEPQAPPATEAPAAAETAPALATFEEASAMLELAVAHYEEVGREQALADFTSGEAPFVDRDLYVFCYGPDRTISAHGVDATLVGVNFDELRDVDGKAFGTEIWDVGSRPGGGSVAYQWLNPVDGTVEPKISAVRKVGEDVCGVGAYGGQ